MRCTGPHFATIFATILPLSNNVVASSTRKGIDNEVEYQELTVVAVGNDNDNDQSMTHVAFPCMTRFHNITKANDYDVAYNGDKPTFTGYTGGKLVLLKLGVKLC